MMQKRIVNFIVVVLVLTFTLAGCSSYTDVTENSAITYASEEITGIFNPLFAQVSSDINVCELLFDSLLEVDKNGEIVPGIAEYESKNGFKDYSFKLKDVTYTNGDAITSDDVLFTIKVLADSSYDGSYDLCPLKIIGFSDYFNGDNDEISGVEIIDNKTFNIHLEEPNITLPSAFTFGVLSKKYYGDAYIRGDISGLAVLNEKPLGSGQYILSEYNIGERVLLTSNQNYYKGTPKIKRVSFISTPIGQEISKIATKECNMTIVPSTVVYLDEFSKIKNCNFNSFSSNIIGTVGFNCDDSLLCDVSVRQAIAYATNRKAVVKQIFGKDTPVSDTVDSINSYTYPKGLNNYNFSIEKARKVLEGAGYKLHNDVYEKNGQKAEFTIFAESSNEVNDVLLPVMKDDLKKAGIIMNVSLTDYNSLLDKVFAGEAQSWVFAWSVTAEPNDISALFETDGNMNIHFYSNDKLDTLYENGRKTNVREKRKEFYSKADKVINEELPCLPLYERKSLIVYDKVLQNVTTSGYRSVFKDFYKISVN